MQRARPRENPRSTNGAASAYPPVVSACSVAADIHLRKSLTHACRRATIAHCASAISDTGFTPICIREHKTSTASS